MKHVDVVAHLSESMGANEIIIENVHAKQLNRKTICAKCTETR